MNVHERATLTLAEYLQENGIPSVRRGGEVFAVVDGTEIRIVVTVNDVVDLEEPPVPCSRCGNDMVREAHAPTCSAAALIRERSS